LNKKLGSSLCPSLSRVYAIPQESLAIAKQTKEFYGKDTEILEKEVKKLRKQMQEAAAKLDFIQAAKYRDAIKTLDGAL